MNKRILNPLTWIRAFEWAYQCAAANRGICCTAQIENYRLSVTIDQTDWISLKLYLVTEEEEKE